MSGHTRGPWRQEGCEIIGDSRTVATVHWCSGLDAEDEANRRLIAAAPDMLDALQKAIAQADANLKKFNGRTEDCEETYERCRAAIIKAVSAT